MEAAASKAVTAKSEPDLIHHWVEIWIRDCNAFRRWERTEVILKTPDLNTVAEHAKRSQLFILSGRLLQGLMTSPDYPAREFRAEVDGKVRQLEETWDMIHNSMSDQEAETILQKAFPDGSRAGSAA
jgi:hypothetical protein